jgi:hypothetical protein
MTGAALEPDDVRAIITGIFVVGARVSDVHAGLIAIRQLLEDDGDEGTEEDPNG